MKVNGLHNLEKAIDTKDKRYQKQPYLDKERREQEELEELERLEAEENSIDEFDHAGKKERRVYFDDDILLELSEIFTNLKNDKKYTSEKLSGYSNLAVFQINRILKGTYKTLTPSMARKVAHILGVDIEHLISGTIPKKKSSLIYDQEQSFNINGDNFSLKATLNTKAFKLFITRDNE
ncbi:MAG TPA: hypothetical protein VFG24_03545, partial [Nitrosopumilaceae archaeon]|nr:hypothetical protein [Nitrosopumilaceae archaeon]